VTRATFALLSLLLFLGASSAVRATAAATAAASEAPPTVQPAEWTSFDMLVRLQNLPRTYSCDDLWYKLRDLLLKLGARAYMTITPYHCGFAGGGPATSPSLELKFQLPRVLSGSDTRYAQISVIDEPIRLAPGSPPSLSDKDCDLVRQLQATLFTALPVHVSAANFSCTTPQPSFMLSVQARIAAGRQAAAQSPPRH
jgi:hypothetical protein